MSALLKDPLVRLQPMGEKDLAAILEIEQLAYSHPWSQGIFRDCLRVGYCCWVCVLDEHVIGYGVMSVAAGECHILNLCVHPQWQGRGLGKNLLHRLLDLARRHQADTAFLEVRESNHVGIALYQAMGFNEVGIRYGYYPADKGREDALAFALNL